jgi:hypothetical protein
MRSPARAPESVTARIPQAVRAKAKVREKSGRALGAKIAMADSTLHGSVGSQQLAIARIAIRK